MKDNRFFFGVTLSIAWTGFAAYMLITADHPSKANEWGDFFAGFSAPLAFFWLVIGYLQQGEELRNSTEVLRLQAEELRNSVEQQSQLVEVSRMQVNQELAALQEERERRRDAARPKFVLQHWGSTFSGGTSKYTLRIANVGNNATKFRMTFDPPLESPHECVSQVVLRNNNLDFQLSFLLTAPTLASIKYIDNDEQPGEVQFLIQAPGNGDLILGDVKRIL